MWIYWTVYIIDHYIDIMNDMISLDLWQLICSSCNSSTQCNLKRITKWFYASIHLTKLTYKSELIDENVLKLHQHITKLNISYNNKVFNVNHLTKLTNLNISHQYAAEKPLCITDDGIFQLTALKTLNAANNHYITNIAPFLQLETLDASDDCGITNDTLLCPTLTSLNISYNKKITDISHLIKLKKVELNLLVSKLPTSIESLIIWHYDKSILDFDLPHLKKLNLSNTKQDVDLNRYKTLESLDLSFSKLSSNSIITLTNLRDLSIDNCFGIVTLNIPDLETLSARWVDTIQFYHHHTTKSFENVLLTNLQMLTKLSIDGCSRITTINIPTIRILHAKNTGLTNEGIKTLTNLEELDITDVADITSLNHCINLKSVSIGGKNCGVNNEGILQLNPESLHIWNNLKVTKIAHMTKLKYLNFNENAIQKSEYEHLPIEFFAVRCNNSNEITFIYPKN